MAAISRDWRSAMAAGSIASSDTAVAPVASAFSILPPPARRKALTACGSVLEISLANSSAASRPSRLV